MKLIVQPDAGVVPIVRAIKAARKTIDVFIFRFDRIEIEKALAAAVLRGVQVRALIAHTNRGGETRLRKLEQRLLAAGLLVSRSTDEKSHLVVSPENAHAMLSTFIAGAKKDLAIYDAKVYDPSIIKLLKEPAAKGVQVRIIGDMKGKDPGIEERKLPMRLHVRAIVRDGSRAFVGSQSLRKDELENRREVGLIIRNPAVARKLLQVFESDWADSSKRARAKAAKDKEKAAKQKAAA